MAVEIRTWLPSVQERRFRPERPQKELQALLVAGLLPLFRWQLEPHRPGPALSLPSRW